MQTRENPTPSPPGFAPELLGTDLRRGVDLLQARSFWHATPLFHAASWTAARTGLLQERLDVQLKLADSQLHAREFQAAVTNYRFAERLAEALDPDGAACWSVRISLAQALRRTGQVEEAREECHAVRARLEQGHVAGPQGTVRRVARMTWLLEAALAAMDGRYAEAARAAAELGDDLLADHDAPNAAAQYYNATVWSLYAAERAGGDWTPAYTRAVAYAARAKDLLAAYPVPGDELKADLDLLFPFVGMVGAKLLLRAGDARGARSELHSAQMDLDRIERGPVPANPVLRLQAALLRMRLAERLGGPAEIAGAIAAVRALVREHRSAAALWVRQDLAARFHWDRDVVPLGQPDPTLEELLAAAAP